MLGNNMGMHTTFVRTSARSAEAFRSLGASSPWILQPPRSVLRSYRRKDSRMRLVILWIYTYIAILRRSISKPFSDRFTIRQQHYYERCTGVARPVVARARAPVCPSVAMPLRHWANRVAYSLWGLCCVHCSPQCWCYCSHMHRWCNCCCLVV